MKLNEVSHRFQLKLEEQQAATSKGPVEAANNESNKSKLGASFRG